MCATPPDKSHCEQNQFNHTLFDNVTHRESHQKPPHHITYDDKVADKRKHSKRGEQSTISQPIPIYHHHRSMYRENQVEM